jgi:hypothetical protein
VALSKDVEGSELLLKPLQCARGYDCRIRAVNTKGACRLLPRWPSRSRDRVPCSVTLLDRCTLLLQKAGWPLTAPALLRAPVPHARRCCFPTGESPWRHCTFTTKQLPIKSAGGERAGGEGAGYQWAQHLKDESILVTVGPLPAGTRAKQLDVKVMPTSVRIALADQELLAGDFFAPISPSETEWELQDCEAGGRELHLTIVKAGTPGQTGPLWASLLKGHLEIDVSGLKRKEKDLDELMAELNTAEAMRGMALAEKVKKEL